MRVIAAENGAEAVALVGRERPDLLVIDAMMPVLDGFAAVPQLRGAEATASMPIVMLTGQSTLEERLTALRAGVAEFVMKPFGTRIFVARVERQLRWRSIPLAGIEPAAGDVSRPRTAGSALETALAAAERYDNEGNGIAAAAAYAEAAACAAACGESTAAATLRRIGDIISRDLRTA